MNSGINTTESYAIALAKRWDHSGKQRNLAAITSEENLSILCKIAQGRKQEIWHGRYSHLEAFFNSVRPNLDPTIQPPCGARLLKRLYRVQGSQSPGTLSNGSDRQNQLKARNRLILELMIRGRMKVGGVLKLTPISGVMRPLSWQYLRKHRQTRQRVAG
jgi:hypothetical protein